MAEESRDIGRLSGWRGFCGLGVMGFPEGAGQTLRMRPSETLRLGSGGLSSRGGGADSRTPSGRLLGQLQPVDCETVDATTHTAPLSFAFHVTV